MASLAATTAGHAQFSCTRCCATFASKEELSRHRGSHSASCTLRCDNGGIVRVEREGVKDGAWWCPACFMKFKGSSAELKEHWKKAGHNKMANIAVKSEPEDDDEPEIVYLGTITRDDKEEEEVKRLLAAKDIIDNDSDDAMDLDIEVTDVAFASAKPEEASNATVTTGVASSPAHAPVCAVEQAPHPAMHREDIPPALLAFLDTFRCPMYHTADIYVRHKFVDEQGLDYLAGIERDNNLDLQEFKEELIVRGKRIAWFAFDAALNRRAAVKGIEVRRL